MHSFTLGSIYTLTDLADLRTSRGKGAGGLPIDAVVCWEAAAASMDGTTEVGAGMGGGGLCWCGALGGTGREGTFLWRGSKQSAGLRVVGEEDDGLGGN